MLNVFVDLLPAKFRPAAKSVVVAVGGSVAVLVHATFAGDWTSTAVQGAVVAVLTALVYGTANE